MEQAAQSVLPSLKTHCIPFSDGGEGSLDFLESHFTGDLQWVETQNALGYSLKAPYYKMGSNWGIGDVTDYVKPAAFLRDRDFIIIDRSDGTQRFTSWDK